jgi:hypothetical protein
MPLQKLQFKAGVNRDQTNYTNEGGWYECDKIRFRSGFPQKLGGWVRQGVYTIIGTARQMFGWFTTFSDDFISIGTNKKLYIEAGTTLYDITPLRITLTSATTPSTDNCVDVTNTSNIVNINITGHGGETGAYVTISGVTGGGSAIGGIPVAQINAEHVITVVDANNFTITVATSATSTVANAGGTAITVAFQINPGYASTTYGYGWGTSTWGRGGWGSGSTQPELLPQRDWWLGNFDNDLVANIRNGQIYYWERGSSTSPASALSTRAALLSSFAGATDVPTEVMQTLVSQDDKHLLAFGCTPFGGGDFDPLLIRWASQDNPFDWTPSTVTSAGFKRISRGSQIVCAIPMRQEILVFTEATLNSLQFVPDVNVVFKPTELADNISIIGPRAVTSANNTAYWMGHDKFYAYSGRVETLPCTLRNHVFENLNYDQADQIISGTNEGWNEIWWMYPSAGSNNNDSYVIYNHLERIWYYGTIERTAWLDSPLREYPQAIETDYANDIGYLYNHEQGTNDGLLPMTAFIASSDFDLTDGDQFILIKRIIPDIDFTGSSAASPEVDFIIKPRNFPGSSYSNEQTKQVIQTSVNVYTNQVFMRARARQMAMEITSDGLDTQWQLGSPRLDGRPDGKR